MLQTSAMTIEPVVISAVISGFAAILVAGFGGWWAYKRISTSANVAANSAVKIAAQTLAIESVRIEQQVEESVWRRTKEQLDDMDAQVKEANRKFNECETHRKVDQTMLMKMRVTLASLEIIIIAMKQEMERNDIKFPFPHLAFNIAGNDDKIFTEQVRGLLATLTGEVHHDDHENG